MRASAVPDDCVITLSAADASKTFKQVNIHKAPVALTSVAMKCFERLVMDHINTIIPETLD